MSTQKTPKPDPTLQKGYASPFSKVEFVTPRFRNGPAPEGTNPPSSAIPATVKFNKNLLKLKLGPEKYKKLMRARQYGVKAKVRFVTPKGGIPYQKAGEEQAYFACPVPGYEGVVSRGADEIVSTLKEDGDVPFDLDTRVHSDIAIANDLDPFPYVKPENNFAFLGVDLSTETIWKDRGSDFNGMARGAYTRAYYFLKALGKAWRKLRWLPRLLLLTITGSPYLTGDVRFYTSKGGPTLPLFSRFKPWWQNFLGRRIALAQRFGFKTVLRKELVSRGIVTPERREVEWSAAEELRQADGSYLAARPPLGQPAVQKMLSKAEELGLDYLIALRCWMTARDLSLEHLTVIAAQTAKPSTDPKINELYDFVLKTAIETPRTAPVPPNREHGTDSCYTCCGSKQKIDEATKAVIPCPDPGCGKFPKPYRMDAETAARHPAAVIEKKDDRIFVRCPHCNAWDKALEAHIGTSVCFSCEECGQLFLVK